VSQATADTVTARWESEATTLAEVLAQADTMRIEAERTGIRAAVVNLVVVCGRSLSPDTRSVLARLGAYHPGRIVIVNLGPDGPDGLGAAVELHCAANGERCLWWEIIELSPRGMVAEHVDSVVEPLLIHDMHVVVWYRHLLPAVAEVLNSAELVVVDGADPELDPTATAASLSALIRFRPVADLAWIRTEPLRQALALLVQRAGEGLIASADLEASVEGPGWEAWLQAGWLAERLGAGHPALRVSVAAGTELEVHLAAGAGRAVASLATGAGAQASLNGTSVRVAGATDTLALVGTVLSRAGRDLRYEAAVHAAARLQAPS